MAARGTCSSRSEKNSSSSPLSNSSIEPPSGQSKNSITCPICTEEVVDSGERKKKGHESVFCDGACQEWLYRQCAGLSKAAFQSVSNSGGPFLCPHCVIAQQSKEISVLKDSFAVLSRDVQALKEMLNSLTVNNGLVAADELSGEPSAPPLRTHSTHNSHTHAGSHSNDSHGLSSYRSGPSHNGVSDKKFNVVLFSVSESPQGTPRNTRNLQDFNLVTSVLSDIEGDSNITCSVHDCSGNCPRPVLVALNSTAQVRHVLMHHHSLPSPITVKPDRSISERKIVKILLTERWKLIQAGLDRRSIKLRSSCLYLNGRFHGKVVNDTYSMAPFLSDLAPELSDLSNVNNGATQTESTSSSSFSSISSSSCPPSN